MTRKIAGTRAAMAGAAFMESSADGGTRLPVNGYLLNPVYLAGVQMTHGDPRRQESNSDLRNIDKLFFFVTSIIMRSIIY